MSTTTLRWRLPAAANTFLEAILGLPKVWKLEREVASEVEYYLICGLSGYEKVWPENLAYGLQRKLEIARALASKPELLLWMNRLQGSTLQKFRN